MMNDSGCIAEPALGRWPGLGRELIKVADVETHICSNFLRICSKSVLFNAKQEKLLFFVFFLAQFDYSIRVLHVFMTF